MSGLDYAVFGIYILGTLGLGGFFYFRSKTSEDLFTAKGQSPWWVAGLSGFMTIFSAATFVVWGGIAYRYGVVALSINMCYGIAALAAGYFVASKWKAMGISTPSEYVCLRFGEAAVQFYIWIMMAFRILGSAVSLYGLAVLLTPLMPLADGNPFQDPETGFFAVKWAIIILGVVVVTYTMAGGLWAVLMTDVVQFIILTLSVVFVVVLLLLQLDDLSEAMGEVPAHFFDLTHGEFTWYFLVAWTLINFVIVGAEWVFAQRYISVQSPSDARKCAYLIGGLYIVSPFIWLLPPLIYRAIEPNANPEQAYILASQLVLPAGMVGVMAAALFSATASLVSSQLNVFAGALTYQVFKARMRPQASERELLWVGRGASVLLGALLVTLAVNIPNLGGAARVIISKAILVIGPLLLPALWGLFSKTIPERSVWITAGASIIAYILLKWALASGGFLADISALSAIGEWAQTSPRMADMFIGVLLPIIVMTLVQLRSKTVDVGWQRLAAIEVKPQPAATQASLNVTPAWIVVVAMAVCSATMFTVAALSDDSRTALLIFASALAVVAAFVAASIRVISRGEAKT